MFKDNDYCWPKWQLFLYLKHKYIYLFSKANKNEVLLKIHRKPQIIMKT